MKKKTLPINQLLILKQKHRGKTVSLKESLGKVTIIDFGLLGVVHVERKPKCGSFIC